MWGPLLGPAGGPPAEPALGSPLADLTRRLDTDADGIPDAVPYGNHNGGSRVRSSGSADVAPGASSGAAGGLADQHEPRHAVDVEPRSLELFERPRPLLTNLGHRLFALVVGDHRWFLGVGLERPGKRLALPIQNQLANDGPEQAQDAATQQLVDRIKNPTRKS